MTTSPTSDEGRDRTDSAAAPVDRPQHAAADQERSLADRLEMAADEHPCSGACLGCGAGSDETCIPPCNCDEGGTCSGAWALVNGLMREAAAALRSALAGDRPQQITDEASNTPPWAEGPCPDVDNYLPSEAFVAGALSTQPPFRTYHPAYCLPLARVALDAFMAYEPDDGHRPLDPAAAPSGVSEPSAEPALPEVRCGDCGTKVDLPALAERYVRYVARQASPPVAAPLGDTPSERPFQDMEEVARRYSPKAVLVFQVDDRWCVATRKAPKTCGAVDAWHMGDTLADAVYEFDHMHSKNWREEPPPPPWTAAPSSVGEPETPGEAGEGGGAMRAAMNLTRQHLVDVFGLAVLIEDRSEEEQAGLNALAVVLDNWSEPWKPGDHVALTLDPGGADEETCTGVVDQVQPRSDLVHVRWDDTGGAGWCDGDDLAPAGEVLS